ncbi:MAG: hypothetical protein A2X05_13390 [Bacteroidetes bacterium GWE2_41_25]|nr:MAG: hypothetical protein A2X03_14250 [Bacteroidetes bacterium GWA2_40_15]OFX91003.1 MAG: hypothetical protein A2X06_04205 [Bacteroidetes bacterium GWC2_40_22]OFY13369.1 MAG: hypothetical protein A2X05_13390 [Bacteroidetes bacterium GWE2_41_25]OFY61957.1 MAG: hypothetical protein A2X04_03160 [Bacteroidetes bacterium GWF2_41_9]HAM09576.1 hypothetical protein [Bacteroidales bacterium]
MKRKRYLVSVLILTLAILAHSQSVLKPNYGLKSHETLEILKIETTAGTTVVYLTVENRIEKGSFCADKNIYIVDQTGVKLKLLKASAIPVCPESYRFKSIGEKLDFRLTFPVLKSGNECVDLIEECSDNCFSFYGIVLDKNLNRELDEAFSLAEGGQSLQALEKFISLAEDNQNRNGITALLYFNIVKLAYETGNKVKAGEWYRKLNSPGVPGGRIYIEQLNLLGIRY